jgi:hypothetical protein
MAAADKIVDLRNLLAERFPQAPLTRARHLQTDLSFLDSVTEGGLPKGAITEAISPQLSACSASLISALLQRAAHAGYFVALIDGRDSFDPSGLGEVGNSCLRHLLWVRCHNGVEAMKAADLLLRDGNFLLVIIDLVLNSAKELGKIPQTSWYRLQRLVEPTSTACLVLSRRSMVASAQLKIVLESFWTLQTFEEADALSGLRLHVQRSHLHRAPEIKAKAS